MERLAEDVLNVLRRRLAERLEEAAERPDVREMTGPEALRKLAAALRADPIVLTD